MIDQHHDKTVGLGVRPGPNVQSRRWILLRGSVGHLLTTDYPCSKVPTVILNKKNTGVLDD